jgi:phage gpG-like protein
MSQTYTVPEYAEALRNLGETIRGEVLGKVAMAGGLVIEAQAKKKVEETFENKLGNLAGSIQTTLVSSAANQAVVEVGPTAIYGRIQELGGTIVPVNAKMLFWVNEAGESRAAWSVTLPARPYMKPAAENYMSEINEAILANLQIEIENNI